MALTENLPHKCTISLRTAARVGNLGGVQDTASVVSENVPCWEQQMGSAEQMRYEKQGIQINRKIYFSTDPNITQRHQIRITERNGTPVAGEPEMKVTTLVDPDVNVGFGNLFRVFVEKTPTVND